MTPKTFVSLVVFLSACGPDFTVESPDSLKSAPVQSSKTKPTATTYALKTTDAFDPAVAPSWKTTFPVYSTYTLFIATEITGGAQGHHVEAVTLTAPGSVIYQRLDLAFAIGVPATATEQQAEQTSTGWRVWTSIPVASTTIQQLNLVGAWSAELQMDATTRAAQASFTLY